MSLNLK
jgi:hypothetical protein